MRRRWIRLLAYLPAYAVFLIVVSWIAFAAIISDDWNAFVSEGLNVFAEPGFWAGAAIPVAILIGVQAVILLPVFQFRLALAEKGKPLLLSIVLLAVFASAITLGFVLGLWEFVIVRFHDRVEVGDEPGFAWVWWGTLAVSWITWTLIFWRYTRRRARPENRISRLIGLVIGGSIVEIALILPVDIMVRRRTDCYCNTGTFFALGFSILACLWLAGPGAFIALTGKRRRAWYDEHCEVCGYERGPTPGERCPECGERWLK